MPGVRHCVMFGIKEGVTDEQIAAVRACMEAMPGKISEIKSWEFGLDLKLESGQNHPAGKNRGIFWHADFDDADAYEVYAKHPVHVECIGKIKEIMEPGTRAAIQYARP
eukprot:gnl/TRDRNA2_/TRDRNA2_81517_c0_seq1.p1 gnl/TRDRNA2_/TRDRNA2_81517_c0~~gnl/TRDRNA2_/TRDRNA2_81517_c0_seq1.p1  ORF type:complete len:127 (-),score=17.04 gnl/TRDRNA2_/TRDRNA2_81517_c0_seq1:206-532(-)